MKAAERAHTDAPGSEQEKHEAYMATRNYELARAEARVHIAGGERDVAEKLHAQGQRRELHEARSAVIRRDAALDAERARRAQAEAEAARALRGLERLAAVEHTKEAVRITISGSVLFAYGASTLLPAAERKLSAVADVLKRKEGA